jgi:hypothetical protein
VCCIDSLNPQPEAVIGGGIARLRGCERLRRCPTDGTF